MAANQQTVVWRAQPGPQTALLTCPIYEVFYGGARGGGKTDGMLGEWVAHAGRYGQHANGLMVRRTRTELVDTIERSRQLYTPLGFTWYEQDKVWRAPNGARLRFAYLERDADAMSYQGHSYTRVYVEEIGNFPNPAPVYKLMATLRSAHGVPVGFRATGNPGGPGHGWVKSRYIDPAPGGYEYITDVRTGLQRVYIPARVSDNQELMRADPGYVARLRGSGSAELVRAWLDGDWTVISGAYFPEFGPQHIVTPHQIPDVWTRYRCMDWGSARPFAVYWLAVSDGEDDRYPAGALVCYREWYGMGEEPNTGLRMTAEDVGAGIRFRDGRDQMTAGLSVLDPAAFATDGGPSIAERMARATDGAVLFRRADNKRIAQRGAMSGWDQLRSRLRGQDGRPMLFVFATCVHLIRTLPALQHDPDRPEDVDTDGEDHAPDALRYGCMARPWMAATEQPEAARVIVAGGDGGATLDDLWADRGLTHVRRV